MSENELETLVDAKLKEAYDAGEHPKKFFLTENGRGVVDGGEMYNALLADMMGIMKKTLIAVLKECK
ncbi:MAG: hypothetical protein J6M62_11075 [Selenomonadaceae bacterium]|nr:hypothetical protein [Selenomonadaceae bacterium]MBP3723325.1 hypothetical protein [Selenomonadaceae bacterium]